MLTADDTPTIRNAITKRLGKEPGVAVADLKFQKYRRGDEYADVEHGGLLRIAQQPFIRVGLLVQLGASIIHKSVFDLPNPFEHGHLLAELDEIVDSFKTARKDFFTAALPVSNEKRIPGTGLRGRWARYG